MFTATLHDGELAVSASPDPITDGDWLSLFDLIAAADPARDASHGILDLSAATDIGSPSIEVMHRVAVNSHLQYPQGPDFKVAFILSDPGTGRSLVELYGSVVSLLAATASTAPGQHPTGRVFSSRSVAERWARPDPPEIARIGAAGYVATFSGLLTLYGIEQVRQQAMAMFEPGELRWAVMDLRDARLRTLTTPEQEDQQVESAHSVARDLQRVRTDSLRLGLVADGELFGAAIELLAAVAANVTTPRPGFNWSMERFDALDDALAWAQESTDGD